VRCNSWSVTAGALAQRKAARSDGRLWYNTREAKIRVGSFLEKPVYASILNTSACPALRRRMAKQPACLAAARSRRPEIDRR
jgi:hypothetical protein